MLCILLLFYFTYITFLKTGWKILVTCLPVAHCMESLAIFHREVNPRRQETAGEVSRCSRTPAHPGKKNKTITARSATSIIQSPFPNNKLTSTSTFKLHTCIQRSPRFMYSLQIFSLQPLFTTTLSMPLRNLMLSRVLGRCCIQFTEDLSKLL